MELEIKAPTTIEEGKHNGVIIGVEYREKPFPYMDLVIEFKVNEEPVKLKSGYPQSVTPDSKLGRELINFGASLEVGGSIDPEKVFVGKAVSFMTMNKKTERGTFANIVNGSLRWIQ